MKMELNTEEIVRLDNILIQSKVFMQNEIEEFKELGMDAVTYKETLKDINILRKKIDEVFDEALKPCD
jgi:hypothetical protein